jgi:hypothetical protein
MEGRGGREGPIGGWRGQAEAAGRGMEGGGPEWDLNLQ